MDWNPANCQTPRQNPKSRLLHRSCFTSMPRSGWPRKNKDAGRTGPRSEGQIRAGRVSGVDLTSQNGMKCKVCSRKPEHRRAICSSIGPCGRYIANVFIEGKFRRLRPPEPPPGRCLTNHEKKIDCGEINCVIKNKKN